MNESGFVLFDTPIGRCGIAWRPGGIVGLQLPEGSERAAAARLERRFPDLAMADPPAFAAAAIARITAFLAGGADDLRDLPLDLSGAGAWERAVYEAARAIPAGTTVTYGALAARVGDPLQARAVGQALGRNPWPIVVPCHRITAAEGRTGGFSAPGGTRTKLKLLEIEGALRAETLPLFGGAA
jgi:methylated-DNA-[protein]-cysteine S-methyltransferase